MHGPGARRVVAEKFTTCRTGGWYAKISPRCRLCGRTGSAEGGASFRKRPTLNVQRPTSNGKQNGRPAFFDRRYCRGTRVAIDDSRSTAGAEAGRCVRFHHARMQYALYILHRAADARSGAESVDRRNRARGARPGRIWSEGSHAARANRKSVWPPRVPETRGQKSLCAVAGSG